MTAVAAPTAQEQIRRLARVCRPCLSVIFFADLPDRVEVAFDAKEEPPAMLGTPEYSRWGIQSWTAYRIYMRETSDDDEPRYREHQCSAR